MKYQKIKLDKKLPDIVITNACKLQNMFPEMEWGLFDDEVILKRVKDDIFSIIPFE